MAKIISVSLGDDVLDELDRISAGFSGRSEAVRTGIKLLAGDLRENDKLSGHAECVLVVVHDRRFENALTKAKHRYEGIISTQVHNNICSGKCLEVFVLHGPAEKIKEFVGEVRRNKRTDYARLVVP